MKKTLKILAIALGSLVALLVVGVVVVSLTFDPNKYKNDIIQIVKQQTGRDLKIDKDLPVLLPLDRRRAAGAATVQCAGLR